VRFALSSVLFYLDFDPFFFFFSCSLAGCFSLYLFIWAIDLSTNMKKKLKFFVCTRMAP
jgi:hypothetical protein